MKKIIALLLTALLVASCFSLFACGGEDDSKPLQPTVYSITYDVVGGELPENAIATYTWSETDITLPVPTKDGYKFLGWLENGKTEIVTVIKAKTTGNKAFVAIWRSEFEVTVQNEVIVKERVREKDKDGNVIRDEIVDRKIDFTDWADGSTGSKTLFVMSGSKLTIPAIKWDNYEEITRTNSDYLFDGWFYKDKDGKEKKFDQNAEFTSDNLNIESNALTIYAKIKMQWTPAV